MVNTKVNEDIEQRHLKKIIEEVGTSESDTTSDIGLFLKCEHGGEYKVADKTDDIAHSVGYIEVYPLP